MGFLIRIGLVLTLSFNLGFCEELMVASYPIIDASLYIDGKLSGQTPLKITIKPGRYKLKAEKKGWISEEKEVVIKEKEEYTFVNIFVRRKEIVEIPVIEPQRIAIKAPKIEPIKEEPSKVVEISKEEPLRIAEISEVEPPKIVKVSKVEAPKIELLKIAKFPKEESPKEYIQMLILKASSLIEEAEKEGAERYAKERIKKAKNLLKKAEKENSVELVLSSINEAQQALKETKEKISYYSSSYVMGIFKNIGK
ncbi:MAG: PEGA domain-containing protein [bacterium]